MPQPSHLPNHWLMLEELDYARPIPGHARMVLSGGGNLVEILVDEDASLDDMAKTIAEASAKARSQMLASQPLGGIPGGFLIANFEPGGPEPKEGLRWAGPFPPAQFSFALASAEREGFRHLLWKPADGGPMDCVWIGRVAFSVPPVRWRDFEAEIAMQDERMSYLAASHVHGLASAKKGAL